MKHLFAIFLSLLAGTSIASADISLSMVPETQNISVGDTFTLDININNVPDLYDYQFSLAFSPSALQADNSAEGALFANTGNSFFSPGTIDNSSGAVTLIADTLFGPGPGVSGPGTLATVQFTALSSGTATISFSPSFDLLLQDSQGNTLAVTAPSEDISVGPAVTVTPEPASIGLVLVAVGLMCLGLLRRKRAPGDSAGLQHVQL